MVGDRYLIANQQDIHFLMFTVVDWIDVFTKPVYKTIILDAIGTIEGVKYF